MARADKIQHRDRTYAGARLGDARAFLQQAEISRELVEGDRRHTTAASSAILAGVAAADAACAYALGYVSSGAHDQAPKILARIDGSTKARGDLSRLLILKTSAQYAGQSLTERRSADAIARATRLIEFAEHLRRH